MGIHIFGDSHSAYCFGYLKKATIHWIGPVTMHRVARDGLGFVTQLVDPINADDVIVLMFGEIDVRSHLVPVSIRTGRPLEEEARLLAKRYCDAVAEARVFLGLPRVVIAEPPFPANRRPNKDFPFEGSIQERIQGHRWLADTLERCCAEKGLLFLPMPKKYAEKSGGLRRVYTDDGVHIMPCEASDIISSLGRLLARKLGMKGCWSTVLLRRMDFILGRPLKKRGRPSICRKYL